MNSDPKIVDPHESIRCHLCHSVVEIADRLICPKSDCGRITCMKCATENKLRNCVRCGHTLFINKEDMKHISKENYVLFYVNPHPVRLAESDNQNFLKIVIKRLVHMQIDNEPFVKGIDLSNEDKKMELIERISKFYMIQRMN